MPVTPGRNAAGDTCTLSRRASSPFHNSLYSNKFAADTPRTHLRAKARSRVPSQLFSCQRTYAPRLVELLLLAAFQAMPRGMALDNKKPGVERRAKPSLVSVGTDSRDARLIVYPVFVTNLTPSLVRNPKACRL